jgi:hypothetical protein
MRALRARVIKRVYAAAYVLGLTGVAAAGLLAVDGRWWTAAAVALVALGLLWFVTALYWPFGVTGYLRRVAGVIRDTNVDFGRARMLAAGPRASHAAATAERQARRLRRMRPPREVASEHAELVRLVEQQADATRRRDRDELDEVHQRLKVHVKALWERAGREP